MDTITLNNFKVVFWVYIWILHTWKTAHVLSDVLSWRLLHIHQFCSHWNTQWILVPCFLMEFQRVNIIYTHTQYKLSTRILPQLTKEYQVVLIFLFLTIFHPIWEQIFQTILQHQWLWWKPFVSWIFWKLLHCFPSKKYKIGDKLTMHQEMEVNDYIIIQ